MLLVPNSKRKINILEIFWISGIGGVSLLQTRSPFSFYSYYSSVSNVFRHTRPSTLRFRSEKVVTTKQLQYFFPYSFCISSWMLVHFDDVVDSRT